MKKISLGVLMILFAASSVMAKGDLIIKKDKAKPATHKILKKAKCTKDCAKKGC